MQVQDISLIEKIRQYISSYNAEQFTLKQVADDIGITLSELITIYKDEAALVEAVLKFEQDSLETLFQDTSFENDNAIDGLLKVSKELSGRFTNILPSFNFHIKNDFPELYQQYFKLRTGFVFA